jgi:hypothetical protein
MADGAPSRERRHINIATVMPRIQNLYNCLAKTRMCLLILEEVPEVIHITFPSSHCRWCLALQNMCLCFWNNVTPGAFCMILILPFQKDLRRGEVTRYVLDMPLSKTRRKSLTCLCCSVPLNMGLSNLGVMSMKSPVCKCPFSKRPGVQILHRCVR